LENKRQLGNHRTSLLLRTGINGTTSTAITTDPGKHCTVGAQFGVGVNMKMGRE